VAVHSLHVSVGKRGEGANAVRRAAYRSGARLRDEKLGVVHDFTRRGGVIAAEIIVPAGAAAWMRERELLWNAAEAAERHPRAWVDREWRVALPWELGRDGQLDLAREFVQEIVLRHGVAADVALHEPTRGGDRRNVHAHILTTTRLATPGGLGAKQRRLDVLPGSRDEVVWAHQRFCDLANARLRARGLEAIDWRRLEVRAQEALDEERWADAVELLRRPQRHLGRAVLRLERRGIETDRGTEHREIVAEAAAARVQADEIRALLAEAVHGYVPVGEVVDWLHTADASAPAPL